MVKFGGIHVLGHPQTIKTQDVVSFRLPWLDHAGTIILFFFGMFRYISLIPTMIFLWYLANPVDSPKNSVLHHQTFHRVRHLPGCARR